MQNTGIEEFTYDSFKLMYDSNPALANYVSFDPKGVTVGKDSMDKINAPTADIDPEHSGVTQAATRAIDL